MEASLLSKVAILGLEMIFTSAVVFVGRNGDIQHLQPLIGIKEELKNTCRSGFGYGRKVHQFTAKHSPLCRCLGRRAPSSRLRPQIPTTLQALSGR